MVGQSTEARMNHNNLVMGVVVALVVLAYLSFFSVVIGG